MKYLLTLILLLLPAALALAADYQPIVGIPGIEDTNAMDFDGYINALYSLSIAIAGLLAVIKIIIAGVKWMTTDIVTSKGEAKKEIQGALIGLMVVLAAVLTLNVINPNLTNVVLSLDTLSPSSASLNLPVATSDGGGYRYTDSDASPAVVVKFNEGCSASGGIFQIADNALKCYVPESGESTADTSINTSCGNLCTPTDMQPYMDSCTVNGGRPVQDKLNLAKIACFR